MAYIMGVDGGNSKTFAVIADEEGRLVGRGLAGCGNHQVPGIDVAIGNIRKSAMMALEQAGLREADIDYVQYGLAGADREKDFRILRPGLATLPFSNWDVVCDTFEGLRAGTPDNVGVVLICGSGTNAAGRNREGATVQTGGFGHLFGDRTGGGDMAKETFSHAVRSWDLREAPSILPDKVAKHLGFADMGQAFDHFLDQDIQEVPRDLTLVLHEAGDEGDELAIRLLRRAGEELGPRREFGDSPSGRLSRRRDSDRDGRQRGAGRQESASARRHAREDRGRERALRFHHPENGARLRFRLIGHGSAGNPGDGRDAPTLRSLRRLSSLASDSARATRTTGHRPPEAADLSAASLFLISGP